MTKPWLSLIVAGVLMGAPVLAEPVFAQAKPYAGQSITVLLPPWGTLPKDMTDRFTAETGIALDMQTLGWDDIRTKIVTSELAGTAPADVTEVDWSWVGQFGGAGWYEPLDGVVSADLRKDAPTDKIFTYDGKLIAMPYNNDYRILIVNAAEAKKAGIEAAPKTLDELMADAKTLKAKGVVTYPIGLPLSATEGSATAWYLLTKAFGGELFDKDFKPLFTDKTSAGYKALAWEAEALKAGLIDPASTGLKDVDIQELFKNGQIAYDVAGWAGNLALYNDKEKSKVAGDAVAALMPSASGPSRTFGLPGAVGIPAASTHKGAAGAFVNWLLQPENQIRMLHGARQPADPHQRPRLARCRGQARGRQGADRAGGAGRASVQPGHAELVSAVLERRRHRHQPGRQGPDQCRRRREADRRRRQRGDEVRLAGRDHDLGHRPAPLGCSK